jgi:hypothetical protein
MLILLPAHHQVRERLPQLYAQALALLLLVALLRTVPASDHSLRSAVKGGDLQLVHQAL